MIRSQQSDPRSQGVGKVVVSGRWVAVTRGWGCGCGHDPCGDLGVLTPGLIVERKPCSRLHPCRLLLSLTGWAGWRCRIRWCSPRACRTCWAEWSIRANSCGVCHGLVVLTAAVCVVAAGARLFVAVAEWVAELADEVAAALGTQRRCPSESTIRRLLGKVDADRFDAASGAFVQRLCAGVAPAGRQRVLAVDGKTLRGSRHADGEGAEVAGWHLLAVIDQHSRVVLGQVAVHGKASETNRFTPLLDTLTSLDLTGVVNHRGRVAHPTRPRHRPRRAGRARGVDGEGQPAPAAPPARRTPLAPRRRPSQRRDRPGHRQIRILQVITIAAGIEFPHARQAVQLTRRTRLHRQEGPVVHRDRLCHHRPCPAEARPEELAAWIRRHWQIDNSLPWVRDLTYAEDLSQIRTATAPQVMATLRNLTISLHRLAGTTNIATTLQHHTHNATRPLQLLKTT